MEQDQQRIFFDHWSTERVSPKTAFYALRETLPKVESV
jgi:hypothetical protein